jgi:hypothetical protein
MVRDPLILATVESRGEGEEDPGANGNLIGLTTLGLDEWGEAHGAWIEVFPAPTGNFEGVSRAALLISHSNNPPRGMC